MDAKRVRVVVSGLVQGVFFRGATADEASRLNLTGWVRNRTDGSVEAEFQGPAQSVDEMVAFCRTGPPSAAVDGIEVDDLEAHPDERGFDVR